MQSLYTTYEAQLKLARLQSLLDPAFSARLLSQAIAGTDFVAYRRFAGEAEDYRQTMALYLADSVLKDRHYRTNKAFPGTDIVLSMSSNELWQGLPPWLPQTEELSTLLRRVVPGIAVQMTWLAALSLTCFKAAKRMRV